jgi:hypothetical protein
VVRAKCGSCTPYAMVRRLIMESGHHWRDTVQIKDFPGKIVESIAVIALILSRRPRQTGDVDREGILETHQGPLYSALSLICHRRPDFLHIPMH